MHTTSHINIEPKLAALQKRCELWYEKIAKEDLLASIDKFNNIGKEEFNRRTGYIAKSYFISYNEEYYDCKSIFVMAYLEKFNRRSSNFDRTAMEGGIRPYAEMLGFRVILL
jgi:hypothetical protein